VFNQSKKCKKQNKSLGIRNDSLSEPYPTIKFLTVLGFVKEGVSIIQKSKHGGQKILQSDGARKIRLIKGRL
jgi:hypothetical protein